MRTDAPIVLLDMDNTVLDFNAAERNALSLVFSTIGVRCDDVVLKRYHELNISFWEKLENGEMSREQILYSRFAALFEELGSDADPREANAMYEKRLAVGHWFMPGAEEMLEALSRFCRLFICSNGAAAVQRGRIESAGIAKYFEGIFISELMGADKPSREYFELCFERIAGFDRARCIIVGDSLTSDIRGGINAGIKTCWYNPARTPNPGSIVPDYETAELSGLEAIIREVFPETK